MPGAAVQPVRGRPPANAGAPRGEEAVRAALIESASLLFADRGPARVSVREVAADAGVNHGLVHHYFGSKDGLLRAVLDDLAAHVADEVSAWDGNDGGFATGESTSRHARISAYLLLDAQDPAAVQTEFPAIGALVRELRRRGMAEQEARARAAQVSALVLGWQLFEPFVAKAAGLSPASRGRSELLTDGVQRLLGANPD
jgi:AcrR family transcriptional regulator